MPPPPWGRFSAASSRRCWDFQVSGLTHKIWFRPKPLVLHDKTPVQNRFSSQTDDVCVPAHLQFCRALMILSLLLGLASIVVSVLGLKCTKLGRTSEQVKGQMALSGGVMFILSGTNSSDSSTLTRTRTGTSL